MSTDTQPSMLVTGASSGIGQAIAVHFAIKGWRVFGTVRKEQDAKALGALHPSLTPVIMDVTREDTVAAAVTAVSEALGGQAPGLDVLVNNAGVGHLGPVETTGAEEWRRVLETNVIGVATTIRHFLPLLRNAKANRAARTYRTSPSSKAPASPRILIIGSASGRVASNLGSVYSASKFGVEAMADTLRLELAPQGIKVSLIEPGPFKTNIQEKMHSEFDALVARVSKDDGARSLYGQALKETQELFHAMERSSIPMEKLLHAVERAATSPHPAARYVVDIQMAALVWLRWACPDWLWDWLYPNLTSLVKWTSSWKSGATASPAGIVAHED